MQRDVVIVSRARTAIGSFEGGLSSLSAPKLGATVLKAAVERAGLEGAEVSEVIMGQVLAAGVGQAPARQASIYAGIPNSVPCTTVNKVCGSGLKAVMLARQSILLSESDIVAAGGMESMSQAPYLLPSARKGMRMGDKTAVDSMIRDGLWDPYQDAHMGSFGDQCAQKFEFSREEQDEFAKLSYQRAQEAQRRGFFDGELVAVKLSDKQETVICEDEEPKRYRPEKMASLRPAFSREGSVTAANASKINDGAAALVLMGDDIAKKKQLTPLVRIVSQANYAHEPAWFSTAPIYAIKKALDQAELSASDVDLFEINEAFSNVTMAAMRELSLPHEKVNVWGGAVALGHPIGCSGARILVTLISAMIQRNAGLGCAALCLGGGGAVAMIVER